MVQSFATVVVVLTAAAPALADDLLSAEINRSETSLEDPIVLTLTVGSQGAGAPKLPALPDFDVRSRGQSTQMQIINGQVSSQVTYTYVLYPKHDGTFVIGAAEIQAGGSTHYSEPITVKVSAQVAAPSQAGRDVFITAELSKKNPYVGEQLIYTFRLYRRVRITDAQAQLPGFDSFVSEDLGKQKDFTLTMGGRQYAVTEMKKILVPQEAGNITIDGAKVDLEVVVRKRGGDPFDPFAGFDSFFGGAQTQHKVVRAAPSQLTVRPLPTPPADFSGLVGSVTLEASLDKANISVGESATLTVKVSGTGNLKAMQTPAVPEVASLKAYPDKPEIDQKETGGTIGGNAVFRTALVGTSPAQLQLQPITVTYFDPQSGSYQTAKSAPLALAIAPGSEHEQLNLLPPPVAAAPKAREDVQVDALLPIHTDSSLWTPTSQHRFVTGVALALALPPLAYLALALWQLRRRRREGSLGRRRQALRRAQDSLDAARAALSGGESTAAAQMAVRAIRQYTNDRLGLGGLSLTPEELLRRLATEGTPGPLLAELRQELEGLERACYGGGAYAVEEKLASLPKLLGQLEQCL